MYLTLLNWTLKNRLNGFKNNLCKYRVLFGAFFFLVLLLLSSIEGLSEQLLLAGRKTTKL